MGLFTKLSIVSFNGDVKDLVWLYDASRDKKLVLIAESAYEVVHVRNGGIAGTYANQKINHAAAKKGIDKYYFVNVKMPCQTEWGTSQKLEYTDAASGKIVSIGAHGVVSFHVSDSRKFMEKVVGSRVKYTAEDLVEEMRPKIMDEFNEHLLAVITENGIHYSQMDGLLKEIGRRLLPKLNDSLAKYGVHIEEFIIKQFLKPQEIKELVNTRAEKNISFTETQLDADQKLAVLQKQEGIELQQLRMSRNKADYGIEMGWKEAKLGADIEKLAYDAKGASYKELREMDREDVKTVGEAEAKVRSATKMPEINVINKKAEGECPHCGGKIKADYIFCPTCRRKVY